MAEQGYDYDQYAPQTSGRLFSSAMFGFNKEEVLEYLEELADENYQRQEAAEMQIQELSQQVYNLQLHLESLQLEQSASPADSTQLQQLAEQLDIANVATQQAEEELAEVREQLYNSQQESAWLRAEKAKIDEQVSDLNRQLDAATSGQWEESKENAQLLQEKEAQLQEKNDALQAQADLLAEKEKQLQEKTTEAARQAEKIEELQKRLNEAMATRRADLTSTATSIIAEANADAEHIRALANEERERVRRQLRASASGVAESITNLRADIGNVEISVTDVLENVQTALASVSTALMHTEQNLNTLGVQVERFPAKSAPVPKPQQVVYFQPAQQEELTLPSQRRRRVQAPESYGQAGFRRLTPDVAGKTRPFRPSYTNGPVGNTAYFTSAEPGTYQEPSEERMRQLAENLVDTLMQMMK